MGGVWGGGYAILYYFALRHALTESSWPVYFRVTFGVAVAAAILGLLQVAIPGKGWLWFPPVGTRAWGPFPNPGVFAGYLIISIFLGVWLLATGRRTQRILSVAGLILLVWCLLLTYNLSAFLAFLVTATVLFGSLVIRRVSGSIALFAAGILLLVLAVLLVMRLPGNSPILIIFDRLAGMTLDNPTMQVRRSFWNAALANIHHEPLLGAGPENFTLVFSRNHRFPPFESLSTAYEDRAHNFLLETFATTGLIGLLALGVLVWAATRGWYRFRQTSKLPEAASLALAGAVGSYLIFLMMWFAYLPAALGLVGILAYVRSVNCPLPNVDRGISARRARGWAVVIGTTLLIATCFRTIPVVLASRAVAPAFAADSPGEMSRHVERALLIGAPEMIELGAMYAAAVADNSSRASQIRDDAALLSWSQTAVPRADGALAKLIAADPKNDRWYLLRGDIYVFAGLLSNDRELVAEAVKNYRTSSRLAPARLAPRYRESSSYLLLGDPDSASRTLDGAEAEGLLSPNTAVLRAQIALTTDDVDSAAAWLERAWEGGFFGGYEQLDEVVQRYGGRGNYVAGAAVLERFLQLRYPRPVPPRPADEELLLELPLLWLHANEPARAIGASRFLASRVPSAASLAAQFERDVTAGHYGPWMRGGNLAATSVWAGWGPYYPSSDARAAP